MGEYLRDLGQILKQDTRSTLAKKEKINKLDSIKMRDACPLKDTIKIQQYKAHIGNDICNTFSQFRMLEQKHHRPDGLNNKHLLLTGLENGQSKIQGPADLLSGETASCLTHGDEGNKGKSDEA